MRILKSKENPSVKITVNLMKQHYTKCVTTDSPRSAWHLYIRVCNYMKKVLARLELSELEISAGEMDENFYVNAIKFSAQAE